MERKFNVGDKVKFTVNNTGYNADRELVTVYVGEEGHIVSIKPDSPWGYIILVDGKISMGYDDGLWHMAVDEIEHVGSN